MENTINASAETTITTNTKGIFGRAKDSVVNTYHNPTVRKAVKYTVGTAAVLGVGYLAFKYFGSKAVEVAPNVASVAADAVAQTAEAVAEATTSV